MKNLDAGSAIPNQQEDWLEDVSTNEIGQKVFEQALERAHENDSKESLQKQLKDLGIRIQRLTNLAKGFTIEKQILARKGQIDYLQTEQKVIGRILDSYIELEEGEIVEEPIENLPDSSIKAMDEEESIEDIPQEWRETFELPHDAIASMEKKFQHLTYEQLQARLEKIEKRIENAINLGHFYSRYNDEEGVANSRARVAELKLRRYVVNKLIETFADTVDVVETNFDHDLQENLALDPRNARTELLKAESHYRAEYKGFSAKDLSKAQSDIKKRILATKQNLKSVSSQEDTKRLNAVIKGLFVELGVINDYLGVEKTSVVDGIVESVDVDVNDSNIIEMSRQEARLERIERLEAAANKQEQEMAQRHAKAMAEVNQVRASRKGEKTPEELMDERYFGDQAQQFRNEEPFMRPMQRVVNRPPSLWSRFKGIFASSDVPAIEQRYQATKKASDAKIREQRGDQTFLGKLWDTVSGKTREARNQQRIQETTAGFRKNVEIGQAYTTVETPPWKNPAKNPAAINPSLERKAPAASKKPRSNKAA